MICQGFQFNNCGTNAQIAGSNKRGRVRFKKKRKKRKRMNPKVFPPEVKVNSVTKIAIIKVVRRVAHVGHDSQIFSFRAIFLKGFIAPRVVVRRRAAAFRSSLQEDLIPDGLLARSEHSDLFAHDMEGPRRAARYDDKRYGHR